MPVADLYDLLDLVAVSIACDIVPVDGENTKILAHFGLKKINSSPRIGLSALMSRTNRVPPLPSATWYSVWGRAINAAGRLGDARDAVKLLLSADRNSALENAAAPVSRNRQRREVDYATAEEVQRRFTELPDWETRKSIVLYSPEWHKGIIGIASSRITETYHRPSVILTKSNERAVGSARSVPGFDLYMALQQCEDLFYSYGGHAHAGTQMPIDNVDAFTERFEQLVQTHLPKGAEQPTLEISAKIRLSELTPEFWKLLKRFEPFGPRNRAPVFWAEGVVDTGRSKILDNNHVRLELKQPGSPRNWQAIAFGLADTFEQIRHKPFDIAFNLREDNWKGDQSDFVAGESHAIVHFVMN